MRLMIVIFNLCIYPSVHLPVCLSIRLIRLTKQANYLLYAFFLLFTLSCIASDSWSSSAQWHVRSAEKSTRACLSNGVSALTPVSDHVSSRVCEKTEERAKTPGLLALSSPICRLSLPLSLYSLFFFFFCMSFSPCLKNHKATLSAILNKSCLITSREFAP